MTSHNFFAFLFLGYFHPCNVLIVIKSIVVTVNIYLILHFHFTKSPWIINLTSVSDEVAGLLTYYSYSDKNPYGNCCIYISVTLYKLWVFFLLIMLHFQWCPKQYVFFNLNFTLICSCLGSHWFNWVELRLSSLHYFLI